MYLKELVDSFEGHPNTTFIWCHSGISRRIVVKNLPGILDGVLGAYKDHVYIDLSWVVFTDYVLKDPDAWTALIRKYPDNFIIGSDIVGGLRNYVSTIRAYDKLFSLLNDEEVVAKVARENFVRLVPQQGITLDPTYKYPETNYLPQ